MKKPIYKRTWFIVLAIVVVLAIIGAINDDGEKEMANEQTTPQEEQQPEKPTKKAKTVNVNTQDKVKKDIEETPAKKEITSSEVEEIIDYSALGEDDRLVSVSVENGEIKAVIELAPHDLLPAEELAVSSYNQASDTLLERDDWEVLTIEFVSVGKVSMNRTEKESNEYGDYFPTRIIKEKLK